MKTFILTLFFVLVVLLIVAGYFYLGFYNVAASKPHSAFVYWFLSSTQDHSVQVHADDIDVPSLNDPSMIQKGLEHYQEMCVTCHGAPGVEPSEIGKGLNPKAPDLEESVEDLTPAEIFWIVDNGIKMTGMPAFGVTQQRDDLWVIVAFLEQLPQFSARDYEERVRAAGLSLHSHEDSDESHEGSEDTGPTSQP